MAKAARVAFPPRIKIAGLPRSRTSPCSQGSWTQSDSLGPFRISWNIWGNFGGLWFTQIRAGSTAATVVEQKSCDWIHPGLSETPSAGPNSLATYLEAIELRFQQGAYQQVLDTTTAALQIYPQSGTLRLWQALATEALGQTQEALALVRPLRHHPDPEVVQHADSLIRIWEAPKLRRRDEWLTQIPDLSSLPDQDRASRRLPQSIQGPAPTSSTHRSSSTPEANPDQSGTTGADPLNNRVIGVLLGLVILVMLWATGWIGLGN